MPDVMDAQEATVAAPEDLRLELTRVIKAPRARVFDAWTRPEMIRVWFGPEGMKPAVVTAEAKVDGAYSIALEGCDNNSSRAAKATGRYTKVNPYDLLQFTWEGDWVPGEESLVTIHLRDVEGGTEIRLIHDRFNTKQSRDGHNAGWMRCLDRLEERLADVLAA
jgi:uncharacterized protein YndB with AHSA1/START domain